MDTFRFVKPRDVPHAIQAASQSKTAQQGAEVRFVAGGTTLIDLMKLNVEQGIFLLEQGIFSREQGILRVDGSHPSR